MNEHLKHYRPAILWAFFILIICNISVERLGQPPRFFAGFDKLVHCGLFFVLVVFSLNNYIRHANYLPIKKAFIITLAIILYGGVIELLQEYIFTWRSGDWWDLFADGVGACMGTFGVLLTIKSVKNGKV